MRLRQCSQCGEFLMASETGPDCIPCQLAEEDRQEGTDPWLEKMQSFETLKADDTRDQCSTEDPIGEVRRCRLEGCRLPLPEDAHKNRRYCPPCAPLARLKASRERYEDKLYILSRIDCMCGANHETAAGCLRAKNAERTKMRRERSRKRKADKA